MSSLTSGLSVAILRVPGGLDTSAAFVGGGPRNSIDDDEMSGDHEEEDQENEKVNDHKSYFNNIDNLNIVHKHSITADFVFKECPFSL